jgi:predicted phosphodiesterase
MEKLRIGPILEDLYARDFEYVLKNYNVTRGEILGILEDYTLHEYLDSRLDKYRLLLKQKENLLSIKGKRFGLISDTHIGNPKARWDYIQMAYDFFAVNQVDAVLHLGDLLDGFQGNDYNKQKSAEIQKYFQDQLTDFESNYPKIIPTYLLLGNHDEWFRQMGFNLFKKLPSLNSTLRVLGYGGYRILLNGVMFYLSHPIANCYCVSNRDCKLVLRGHSHYFEYNQHRGLFRLNTCSDTHPNPASGSYELAGGFSLLSFPKNMICFENYSFYHDDIVKSLCLKL